MAYNGPGASVAGEVVITVPQDRVPYDMMAEPEFHNGGQWASEATDLDLFYYNLHSLMGEWTRMAMATGYPEHGKKDNYAFTVSKIGDDGDLVINMAVEHIGSNYVIKINKQAGNELAFRNVIGGLRRLLLGDRWNNIEENPKNNKEPGQGGYRRRRKTYRRRRGRSHKTKSRRHRK